MYFIRLHIQSKNTTHCVTLHNNDNEVDDHDVYDKNNNKKKAYDDDVVEHNDY